MGVPKHTLKPSEREDQEKRGTDTALGHSNIQQPAKETEKERPVKQKKTGREGHEQKATGSDQLLLKG